MPPGDRDTGAPNLAPHQPIFTGLLQFDGLPLAQNRRIIPVSFNEFTEGFLVSISNRPHQPAFSAAEAALCFLINSVIGPDAQFRLLNLAEFVLPGCNYQQALPGWIDKITIDFVGVNPADFALLTPVQAQVTVYRLDRATRNDWRGKGA